MRHRRLERLGWGIVLGTSTACVHYVPVDLEAVRPEEEVRVRVDDGTAVRLARHFGQIRQELDASVAPGDPDSVLLTVWIGRDYPGTAFANVRESVTVGRGDITSLRRRELSLWRSAGAAAAVLGFFAVLIDHVVLQEDPNPPSDGGPIIPPYVVVPLARVLPGGAP